jgi:hypothetical protein
VILRICTDTGTFLDPAPLRQSDVSIGIDSESDRIAWAAWADVEIGGYRALAPVLCKWLWGSDLALENLAGSYRVGVGWTAGMGSATCTEYRY